jgi:hypothetical protein
MPETDQEVFEHFRSDYGSSREIALLAYARFAQDKYDWVTHYTKGGQAPTEAEIARWIHEIPNSRYLELHNSAANTFRDAAEEYMKPRIEEERAKAVDSSILNRVETMAGRVERATSFRATWFPNLCVAVIASFAFAAIIILSHFIFDTDPSLFKH